MPMLRSRPQLLAAFRGGDREAMAEVYWAYAPRVESFARHVAAPSDVPDLVQEVFTRVFSETGRRSYDGTRDLGPYLLAIARNLVIDRAHRAGRELPTGEASLLEVEAEEAQAMPWADADTMRVVEGYVAALPPDLRAIHETRYERGLPQRGAAASLGISRQQLRTREAHLRAGLEDALRAANKL
jgi:RNA polymerase sigma-70 factor, ECF subfamily